MKKPRIPAMYGNVRMYKGEKVLPQRIKLAKLRGSPVRFAIQNPATGEEMSGAKLTLEQGKDGNKVARLTEVKGTRFRSEDGYELKPIKEAVAEAALRGATKVVADFHDASEAKLLTDAGIPMVEGTNQCVLVIKRRPEKV